MSDLVNIYTVRHNVSNPINWVVLKYSGDRGSVYLRTVFSRGNVSQTLLMVYDILPKIPKHKLRRVAYLPNMYPIYAGELRSLRDPFSNAWFGHRNTYEVIKNSLHRYSVSTFENIEVAMMMEELIS